MFAASWELSAIPMFLLMGAIASNSGIGTALFRAAHAWFGALPGGLAVATNWACAGLRRSLRIEHRGRRRDGAARRAGNAASTNTTRGSRPASCASGGTLDALIPPSILFVIYGVFAEVSVAKLLIAGILPGLLTAVVYMHHDHRPLLARSVAGAAGRISRPRRAVARALGIRSAESGRSSC